jgi:Gram-negative bacterial tonB protein.
MIRSIVLAMAMLATVNVAAATKVQIAQGENVMTLRVDGDLSIDPAGRVVDYRIRTKLDPQLAKLVAKAVPAWQFQPVLVNGKGIPAKSSMRITLAATEVKGGYEVRVDNIVFRPDTLEEYEASRAAVQAELERQAADPAAVASAEKPRQFVGITSRKLFPPSYPSSLMKSGVEGVVLLILRLNPDGSVADVFASQSSLLNVKGKPELLDRARTMLEKNAAATAAKWTFDVQAKNMAALTSSDLTVSVPVEYVLTSGTTRGASLDGKWRHEFRGPNFPVPWLLAGEDQMIGVSDLDSGQVMAGNATFRLKDKSVIGTVL